MAPRKKNTKVVVRKIDSENIVYENALCLVCRGVLIEPVTLPCGHNFCLLCFNETVNNAALVCPLCRTRISIWLRSARKTNNLVNETLWNIIKEKFGSYVEEKLQNQDDTFEDNLPQAPRILASAGEINEEYIKQLQIERENERIEREKEERASAQLIRKLQEEESVLRKAEEERIKRDAEVAKMLAEQEASTLVHSTPKQTTIAQLMSFQKSNSKSPKGLTKVGRQNTKNSATKHKVLTKPPRVNSVKKYFPAGLHPSEKKQYLLNNSVDYMTSILAKETDDTINKEISHIKPISQSPLTPPRVDNMGRVIKSPLLKIMPIRPNGSQQYNQIKSSNLQILSPTDDRQSAFAVKSPNNVVDRCNAPTQKTKAVKKITFNEVDVPTINHSLILKSPEGSPFMGFNGVNKEHFSKFKEALSHNFPGVSSNHSIKPTFDKCDEKVDTTPTKKSKSSIFAPKQLSNSFAGFSNINNSLIESEILKQQKFLEQTILQEQKDFELAKQLHAELNRIEPRTYELRTSSNRCTRLNHSLSRPTQKRQRTIDEICSQKKYKV